MKYVYEEKDLDIVSWERIDNFVNKIYTDVNQYVTEKKLHIKYIVPILRGGGVPAVILSHKLNVIDMLPIQLKCNSENIIETKLELNYIDNPKINDDECILLVEGNHVTGRTANIATNMIREKFGQSVKIIYVSLTRDYKNRNTVKDICFTTWAMTTNETKSLSKLECEKLGIDYSHVTVYPWENVKEELYELNLDNV